jgi:hypothetical protein
MSTQAERIDKLQTVVFSEGEKLIFEWVKTGQITVREFSELVRANYSLGKNA